VRGREHRRNATIPLGIVMIQHAAYMLRAPRASVMPVIRAGLRHLADQIRRQHPAVLRAADLGDPRDVRSAR
jgi:hypothetical protein